MLDARFKFVGHPDFGDSNATDAILGLMPETVGRGKGAGRARGRQALADSDDDFQGPKFLTREQEVHLFRKMNFLKYQAAHNLKAINPTRARSAELDRIDELLREAGAIRNRIIRTYLGLVVGVVKKLTRPSQDFSDLVSEGNVSLIQASEQFVGISKERVRQLETRALNKLRVRAAVQKLDPAYDSARGDDGHDA